jgi:hypothetical protein
MGAMGLIAYLWVGAIRDRDAYADRLEYLSRQNEMIKYQKDVQAAPDQARKILEELDEAARLADAGEPVALGGNVTLAASPTANPNGKDGPKEGTNSATNLSPTDNPGVVTDIPLEANANGPSPPGADGPPGGEAPAEPIAVFTPDTPESKAWGIFWKNWPQPPTGDSHLEVADFRLAEGGQFTFNLKVEDPGQRARGRSVAIFAVVDNRGRVTLAPVPEFPLKDSAAAFKAGARYNILSSKVVKGKVPIPQGGKILSVEIMAFDEDSSELVLRERINFEDQ